MLEKVSNPIIKWQVVNNEECLYFTFKGTLTQRDASCGMEEWKKSFNARNGKLLVIWNCLEMKGYEPMARAVWQQGIKELKDQIAEIWLITDSTIIQAGAKIMSLFTSFNLKVKKSIDELLAEQNK